MAAKFFGQFLLEKGVISSAQLLEALEIQRASNPLLGEMAESMGLLTTEQAAKVNERQRRENRRFGDLAQDLGLLTAEQVDTLIAEQKARRKLFGEILVERGMLTRQALEAELALHERDRDDAAQALELGIAGHPLADVAGAAIDSCHRLFPRIVGKRCQFSALVTGAARLDRYDVGVCIRITGDRSFALGLACGRELMGSVAAAFLGSAPADLDDALAHDALGEYLNVLMGYVVKDVLPLDASYRAAPPTHGHLDSGFLGAGDDSLVIGMTSELGPFALVIERTTVPFIASAP